MDDADFPRSNTTERLGTVLRRVAARLVATQKISAGPIPAPGASNEVSDRGTVCAAQGPSARDCGDIEEKRPRGDAASCSPCRPVPTGTDATRGKGGPARGNTHRPGAAKPVGEIGPGGTRSTLEKDGPATFQQLARRYMGLIKPTARATSPLSLVGNRPSGYGTTTQPREFRAQQRLDRWDPIAARCSGRHASWYACPLWIREIEIVPSKPPLPRHAAAVRLLGARRTAANFHSAYSADVV